MRPSTKPPQGMAGNGSNSGGKDRYIQNVHRSWERKLSKLYFSSESVRPYPNLDLPKEWEIFLRTSFPPVARGQEVDGIDLSQLRSDAAGCIQKYLDSGSLDWASFDVLEECMGDLTRIVPLLVSDVAAYFQQLLNCSDEVLGRIVDI
jgi:hypothetical protein